MRSMKPTPASPDEAIAVRADTRRLLHAALGPLALLALLALGLWNLDGPPMWWDEGWTLSVARNLVERGHYGRLLDGQLAPNGLEASPWVTGPVALMMKVLGVGLWQGRTFGVICTAAALAMLYHLARRIYNRRVAIAAILVLLFMSLHPQLNPLVMGRQVLAELPMFVYLLAGYLGLLAALRRAAAGARAGALFWAAIGALAWAVAIQSKAQALPFWLVGVTVPAIALLWRRRWPAATLLAVTALAALGFRPLVNLLPATLLAGRTLPLQPIENLAMLVAFVTQPFNRAFALTIVMAGGLPTLAGLCHASWRWWRGGWANLDDWAYAIRLSLLSLAGSWFAWYLLLSVGPPRYLFPATFFGSVFAAALLERLTGGFDLPATARRAAALRPGGLRRQTVGSALAVLVVTAATTITAVTLYRNYVAYDDRSAFRVAAFLNDSTPPDTLVETYESELHFLLDRPYHWPPDQAHVELNKRSLLGQEDAPLDYDPIATAPDYLVVGSVGHLWRLYDPALESGAFTLVYQAGEYEVYRRAR